MTADPLCTQTRLARVVRVGLLAFGAGGAYIAAALVYVGVSVAIVLAMSFVSCVALCVACLKGMR